MAGRVEGKVAFITGAARGQGRSHALRLAEEGADIVALDLCGQLDTVPYPMADPGDLEETVRLVEERGRRIVARQTDARDLSAVQAVVDEGLKELGHIDIVCANAGIMGLADNAWTINEEQWDEMIVVNLTSVWKTCKAAIPPMIEAERGGSIIITSSTAGIKGLASRAHYVSSKHGVVGLMRTLSNELAEYGIRVNTVHPTVVATPMVQNQQYEAWLGERPEVRGAMSNLLPVDMIEAVDVSNAVLWLSSDEARYVTGVTLPVDAGNTQK